MADFDFLIVGSGLAGQLLARSLARHSQTVVLAHDPRRGGASQAAAWMINPITGIRFVPSWRVDKFLPFSISCYQEIERESQLKIWNPLPIFRMFQEPAELSRWEKKRGQTAILPYVADEFDGSPSVKNLRHAAGGIIFQGGGWANLGPWLRLHLERPLAGIEVCAGNVDCGALNRDKPTWNGRTFARVIFCTGFTPTSLWRFPWKPAKGELITVKIPGLDLDAILLRGIFVIPLGGEYYRVGATYEWDDLSESCTFCGVAYLREKLVALIDLPFEIVDAQAAIRPILQDARPVLGMDSRYPRFGVCNGFGSKAALIGPAVCQQFADHLVEGTPLDMEMTLDRLPPEYGFC